MYSEHDLFIDLRDGRKTTFDHAGNTYGHKKNANGSHTVTTQDGRTATTPASGCTMLTLRAIAAWIHHSTRSKNVTFSKEGDVIHEERTQKP